MEALTVGSPVDGTAVALEQVPDPVFAQAMVGAGAAVRPSPAGAVDAVAPVSGTLAKVHPHAFVVATDAGPAVLVHLGLDTVRLAGEHFTVRRTTGERVDRGEVVVHWDVAATVAAGYDPIVPVVVLDRPVEDVLTGEAVVGGTSVAAGETLLAVRLADDPPA